jgi:hypothetical protein
MTTAALGELIAEPIREDEALRAGASRGSRQAFANRRARRPRQNGNSSVGSKGYAYRINSAERALIAQGDGPQVVQVRRRWRTDSGVQVRDHRRWVRDNEWAKFLVAEATRERRK